MINPACAMFVNTNTRKKKKKKTNCRFPAYSSFHISSSLGILRHVL